MQTSKIIKASKIALAVATLMAAQNASAFDVYVSGASALRDSMPRLMNRFCQTAGRAVAEVGTTAANADKDRRVYSCTFHTAATNAAVAAELGANLVGKQVNVYHSVEPGNALDNAVGGSITGIIPLLSGSSNTLLNFAVKGGTANGVDTTFVGAAKTFTTQVTAVPQIGLTDVEPSKFSGAFGNVPTDPAAIAAGWTISGSQDPATLVNEVAFVGGFGVAVSKNLINAGVTNISQDQLAAVLSGDVANWNQIGGPDLPVRVCRRAPGSGTQATFNAIVSRKGCGANVNAFEYIVGDASNPQITENATTGLVKSCLTAANTAGTEGAIGIMGLENNAVDATIVNGVATQTWQLIDFNGVKIWDTTETAANTVDGTVDNIREEKIISGQYPLAVESTVVKSQKVALTADQQAFYTLLKDKAGDPIFTKSLPGVVSDSTKTTGNLPNLSEGATNFTRGGDTCNPLSLSL